MMDTMVNKNIALLKREIPKINGSTGAFIALIVILGLFIIASFSAVIYLLREEISEDEEAGTRGRYKAPGTRDIPTPSPPRKWISGMLPTSLFSRKPSNAQSLKSRISIRRVGQGWFQAQVYNNWEADSADEQLVERHRTAPSATTILTSENDSSLLGTPQSSTVGFPRLNNSPHSDTASSHRSDPGNSHRLSYQDQSTRVVIPSIHSHLDSIPMSDTTNSSPRSSELSHSVDHDSTTFSPSQSQSTIRTFRGGSKFIEAL